MYIMKDEELDDPRREFLINALTAGAFMTAGLVSPAQAGIFGKRPYRLPRGKSFFDIKGDVRVNGKRANLDTLIRATDTVQTGSKSQAIFVVGKDSFILRDNSKLRLKGRGVFLNSMRLFSGKLLSVFGKRKRGQTLFTRTTTATMGIRGTGVYLEAEPDLSYICTCYGKTSIASVKDPSSAELIQSVHHDAPRYIAAKGSAGKLIQPAPFKNHSDLELMLIEELVGRTPPFSVSDVDYSAPRRGY